jgi:hypothetical protein
MGKGYPIGTIERGEVINPAPHEKCMTGKTASNKKNSRKVLAMIAEPMKMNAA